MNASLWLFATFLLCITCWEYSTAVSSRDYEERQQATSRLENADSEMSENPDEFTGIIDLSYEECSNNGVCKTFKKFVKKLPFTSHWQPVNHGDERWNRVLRSKRKIFGADNRIQIHAPFKHAFPFSSTVAIGHGNVIACNGVALTRNLILTAAHCLLSSSGDIVSDLRVGVLSGNDMKWTKVKNTMYHVIWKREKGRTNRKKTFKKFHYDYAVLETVSQLDVSTMGIAVVGKDNKGQERLMQGKTYIHFSAFDDIVPSVLRYRFCRVEKVTQRKIFSKCDTVAKTAGAGVYVHMRNKDTRKVERKVIAIETGDYKRRFNQEVKFSTARRITRLQFVQICYWVTKDYRKCSGTEF